MLLLGLTMMFSQYQTSYASDQGIILENGLHLRTIPTENSAILNEETLKTGEKVIIRESRNKWIRVKAGKAVGWLPANAVGPLFLPPVNVF